MLNIETNQARKGFFNVCYLLKIFGRDFTFIFDSLLTDFYHMINY